MIKKILLLLILTCITLTSCSENCPQCRAGDDAIFSFSSEMYQANGWYLDSYGGSYPDADAIQKLTVSYVVCSEVNFDEARALIVDGVERFLSSLNNNSQVKPYLNRSFGYKDIDFSIAFCLPDGNFMRGNKIAVVSLVNGIVGYSTYNEHTNRLNLLWERDEQYSTALEAVGSLDSMPHIKISYLKNKKALMGNSTSSPAYIRKLYVSGENLQRRFRDDKK